MHHSVRDSYQLRTSAPGNRLGLRKPTPYPATVVRPVNPTPFRSERLPRSAWEVITFVGAAAIVIDVALLAVSLAVDNIGSGQLGSPWKVGKMLALVLMLAVVAVTIRSPGTGVSVVLLTVFFLEESGMIGYRLGTGVAELLDLTPLETMIPAPAEAWGTFLVLGVLTLVIELTLSFTGANHSPLMRRAGRVLGTLLGLLFAFAGVWGLFAEAFPEARLGIVAEFGTLFVLSLMIASTSGLLRVASLWSRF